MKNLGIILTGTLILLIGLWLIPIFRVSTLKDNDQIQQKIYQTQTNEQNDVSVEVTPISLETNSLVKFKVVLDTHILELDYDLMKISKLTDDKGQIYNPISWSGGSGGHHLSGELIFPAVPDKAKSLELTISNIEGVDRMFRWDL